MLKPLDKADDFCKTRNASVFLFLSPGRCLGEGFMLTSLAFIFIVGLAMAAICEQVKLPRIIGMLATGVVLGPYVINALAPTIMEISPDLREMGLIIILIQAGLSLNLSDLKKIGRPAILMSFLPALFEIAGFMVVGPLLLDITLLEAAIMGSVLGAVSPAVVVTKMLQLMDEGYGTNKSIPDLIIAGSALDDVFVIVLFTALVDMALGGELTAAEFLVIPISIVLGGVTGVGLGWLLSTLFELSYEHGRLVRNSMKVIILLGFAFLLVAVEIWLEDIIPFSGLVAVICMAGALQYNSIRSVADRLSEKYGKLWIAAEVILFVLVGAAVDIRYTLQAGIAAVLAILLALVFRSVGVLICLIKTGFNLREKLFCVIAYLPKATVQAAIGSIPLAKGLACGNLVLSVAVLSILITAPLGAMGMDLSYKRLLKQTVTEQQSQEGERLPADSAA